jgi:hypothetical protein
MCLSGDVEIPLPWAGCCRRSESLAAWVAWTLGAGIVLFASRATAGPALADEGCQLQADPAGSFNLAGMSDLGIPPNGTAIGDDFVPVSDMLTGVTVLGTYMDAVGDGPSGPHGYEQFECVWKVPPESESFRVRIYEDDVTAPGQPGVLIAEQSVSGENVRRASVAGAGFEATYGFGMYEWTLVLSPVTLVPGTIYWLEVTSDRNVCPGGACADGLCHGGARHGQTCDPDSTCYWHWWQTYRESAGNDWAFFGTDDRWELGNLPGSGHVPGAGRAVDLQFCLSGPAGALEFTAPAAPTGACCDCDDFCTDDVTLVDCSETAQGAWNLGAECTDWGVCWEVFDVCDTGGGIVGYDGFFAFDTTCYTTDHPASQAEEGLGKDIWFAYTATCTGRLVASMCASGNGHGGYDSFITVYHHPQTPFDCVCPGSNPPPELIVATSDQDCNGIADGGAGIVDGIPVEPGECYTIRVSGHGFTEHEATAGRGLLDMRCMPYLCHPPSPPRPETLPLPGDPVNAKVRYLSFHGGDTGRNQAVRVTFVGLPAPYEEWNGTVMWVQEPEVYCENAGTVQEWPFHCFNPLEIPDQEFLGATAGCDPYYTDWTYDYEGWFVPQPAVHVFHEGIVPGGIYRVQLIDEHCSIDVEEYYSEQLVVTMSRWGDVVKDCTTHPCGPPDGNVGIVDVTAVLDKFKNYYGCVQKARADLEGSPAGDHRVPDQAINITDVTYCLGAFLGETYPAPGFPPPSPPPCQP